jgi:hypothetical protein
MTTNKATFTRFLDQHGRERLHVQLGGKSAVITFADLWCDPKSAMAQLAAAAVFIPEGHTQLRKLASALPIGPTRSIIDKTGWHDGIYAMGDGTIFAPNSQSGAAVEFPIDIEGWAESGTLEEWKTLIGPLLIGQALPRFALAVSVAPPLIGLTDITGNLTFDLCGETSSGKSSILDIASSCWGPPSFHGRTHYSMTWNTTVHGLGLAMDRHNDALLAIDELNALGDGGSERGSKMLLKNAIFTLAAGVQKTSANNATPVTSRFVALSTSNSALAQTVGTATDGAAKAASVRMIPIPSASGSPYKSFDKVPTGCKDIPEAIAQLKVVIRNNHGVVARAFVSRLVKERANGEDALKLKIAGLMAVFLEKAGNPTDGAAHRVAEWFALIHAANTLALEWGVFPKIWRSDYVLVIYWRYVAYVLDGVAKTPLQWLADYANEGELPRFDATDFKAGKKRVSALADKGYVDIGSHGRAELVLPVEFRTHAQALASIRAAKAIGALTTDGGKSRTLQTKRAIDGKTTRCFLVRLDLIMAELKKTERSHGSR